MINIGRARLPRVKLPKGRFGDVARIPQARGGRTAHPPLVEKKIVEKINKKERRKAIRSAIAATACKELAIKRGHKIDAGIPIILDDSFEKISKTKEVLALFEKLFKKELNRTKEVKIKAGRGKTRGRKFKKKKGPLVVFLKECAAMKASKNITGVDVSLVKKLNADLLAPGGQPGRLTVFTESSLNELDKLFR